MKREANFSSLQRYEADDVNKIINANHQIRFSVQFVVDFIYAVYNNKIHYFLLKEPCEIQVKIGANVSYIRNFFYLCIDK
jgi:hypothetical protein